MLDDANELSPVGVWNSQGDNPFLMVSSRGDTLSGFFKFHQLLLFVLRFCFDCEALSLVSCFYFISETILNFFLGIFIVIGFSDNFFSELDESIFYCS